MRFAAIFTGVAIRNAGDEECNMLHVERRCLREHRENNLLSRTNGLPPLLDGTGYWTAWPFTTMAIFSGDDEPLAGTATVKIVSPSVCTRVAGSPAVAIAITAG